MRRGIMRNLVALFFFLVMGVSFTGCGTTVAQHRAGESAAKAFSAYADLIENETMTVVSAGRILEVTSLTLTPTSILTQDPQAKIFEDLKVLVRYSPQWFRLFGQMAVATAYDDNNEMRRCLQAMVTLFQTMPEQLAEKINLSKQQLEALRAVDITTIRNEQIRNRVVKVFNMNKLIISLEMTKAQELIRISGEKANSVAVELRDKAFTILTNPQESLASRSIALEKYSVGLQVPQVIDAFTVKHIEGVEGLKQANDALIEALNNPKYSVEDYRALIDRFDKSLQDFEKAASIVKRLIPIIAIP
jgi:hypothetical protein